MQPRPPHTRQSGPEAKEADAADALHKIPPGGPIKPSKQGFVNPGPTDNLRGVEPNTAMHRGTPNPEQHGSHGPIGDYVHDPGMDNGNHFGHGVPTPIVGSKEKHSATSAKLNVKDGVNPGHFARHEGEVHSK